MKLTIDETVYKYKFDEKLTYEVICYLFSLNYKQTGQTYITTQNLYTLLLLIDVISLQETYHLVIGEEYIFSADYPLLGLFGRYISTNSLLLEKFKQSYKNGLHKSIFSCNDIQAITNIKQFNHLSMYIEELATKVYIEHMLYNSYNDLLNKLLVKEVHSCPIYKYKTVKSPIHYISLDYLIIVFNLDKEAIIEMLALHNFKLKL